MTVAPGRLDALFARCREEGRAALVGYLPAGFPSYDEAVAGMLAMVEGGVDAIEIGMPYSDPLMEGPVIQAAHQAALEAGTRTADVLRTVRAVADTGVPTLVMGYWNPVHAYGFARWAADLAAAGGTGAITPDLIPEEAPEWLAAAAEHGIDPVFLVAPSSTDERIAVVGRTNRGFVYAAAVMGVTGARSEVGAGRAAARRAGARAHRPARRRRARREHRGAGRAGRRVRRRGDRGLRAGVGPADGGPDAVRALTA